MSVQMEETIEVLREVIQIVISILKEKDEMRMHTPTRDIRIEAVKKVAIKRGVERQTVHDKLTRKIRLHIDEFDKLLFDYVISNNQRLKVHLLQFAKDAEYKRAIDRLW